VEGERYRDRQVVDALVDVVAPREFVAHLSTLRELALPRLALLTGRDFGPSPASWRDWWTAASAQPRFVGARRHVALTADNARAAILEWRTAPAEKRAVVLTAEAEASAAESRTSIVLRGEETIAPDAADNAVVLIVTADELTKLVGTLERFGFMGNAPARRGLADQRQLTLVVDGAVVRSDPQLSTAAFDRFGSEITNV
jgi:hypothetical protein